MTHKADSCNNPLSFYGVVTGKKSIISRRVNWFSRGMSRRPRAVSRQQTPSRSRRRAAVVNRTRGCTPSEFQIFREKKSSRVPRPGTFAPRSGSHWSAPIGHRRSRKHSCCTLTQRYTLGTVCSIYNYNHRVESESNIHLFDFWLANLKIIVCIV